MNLEEVRDAIIPWDRVVPVASDEGSVLCLATLNLWECPESREHVGILGAQHPVWEYCLTVKSRNCRLGC